MNIFYKATSATEKDRLQELGWLGHALKEHYKHPVILVDTKEDRSWLSGFFLPFIEVQVGVHGTTVIKDCDILVVAFRNHHKEGLQQMINFLDCDLFDFVEHQYWNDYEIRRKKYEELYSIQPEVFSPKVERKTAKKKEVVTPPSPEQQLIF